MKKDIYQAPKSELYQEGFTSEDLNLARRRDRFWASMIDALTIIPISFLLMYYSGFFDDIKSDVAPSMLYTLTLSAITTAIFLLMHGKIMVRDGQTWGKKALNIKIVSVDGEHASISHLAKRYGFYWAIPLIPFVGQFINLANILFIFSKSKRCLHDYVGETKVVRVDKSSQQDK